MTKAEELWLQLGDVPINDDDEIELPFLHFPAGTNRFGIWLWFEETFNRSVARDLQGLTSEKLRRTDKDRNNGGEMTNNDIELQVLITIREGMIAENAMRVARQEYPIYGETEFTAIAQHMRDLKDPVCTCNPIRGYHLYSCPCIPNERIG